MAQQLSLEQIKQVASLARLELSEDEQAKLTGQLNDILEQFARLQELDTTGIPPTSHSLDLRNVLRDDIARPSLPRDSATLNAPEKRDGNFIVPQIVDLI
jgi:aspartyl-tRNA(Asn)/glutamyl-tRNA(Gln) amidotransferase subunit C